MLFIYIFFARGLEVKKEKETSTPKTSAKQNSLLQPGLI